MKKALQEQLLAKEMTRKQFLQVLLTVVLSILGLNNLISLLSHTAKSGSNTDVTASHGFGSSKFGA